MNTEKNSNAYNVEPQNKGDRVGLWVGLGAAALTAIGVVGLAIYTDYKENNQEQLAASSIVSEQEPSTVPTSQAQAESIATQTSDQQVQGMTAPSDEEDNSNSTPIAMASGVVGAVVASGTNNAALQPVLPNQQAAASAVQAAPAPMIVVPNTPTIASAPVAPSPADTILAKENAIQAESKVVAENGMVRFYFATGKADVTANTLESLKDTVEGAKAGKKVVILSYSNVESNERLARDRALAVRSVLLAAGIPDSSIEVSNPTAENGDSRRVEVVLR